GGRGRADGKVRIDAGMSGSKHEAAGAEIAVFVGKSLLVEGRKVVGNTKRAAIQGKFDEGITVICTACIGVKSAVADGDIYVTGAVGGKSTSRLPDAAALAIWCIVPDRDWMERGGVESDYPAMIEAVIVVGGPRQVNYSLGEQQGWTLQLDFVWKVIWPLLLPLPLPGTEPWITTGPPNFSAPLVISSACKRDVRSCRSPWWRPARKAFHCCRRLLVCW